MRKFRPQTLVQCWVHVETKVNNISLVEAVKKLNYAVKAKHKPARVRKWYMSSEDTGRGTQLPRRVRIYMCHIVIEYALTTSGVPDKCLKDIDIKRLINMLQ